MPALPQRWREALVARFELSRNGGQGNLRPMEGMRGLAVLLVFMTHYVSLITPWLQPDSELAAVARALHTMGTTGVDLFFVLSGYLIYGALMDRPQSFVGFMARRLRRIYPAFLAVFLIYVLASYLLPAERKIPQGQWAASLYLLQNLMLLPGLLNIPPMITVAWSLSYEMFYYLSMPALIALLGLRIRPRRQRMEIWLLLAVLMLGLFASHVGPVALVMFLAGVMLWELQQSGREPPPYWVAVAALPLGLAASLLPLSGPSGASLKTACLALCFMLLCWVCTERPKQGLALMLSWTPLRWLGNMSYSFYLLHGLSMKAGFMLLARIVPPAPSGVLWFLLCLAPMLMLSLLISVALYLGVELPLSLRPTTMRNLSDGATARPSA